MRNPLAGLIAILAVVAALSPVLRGQDAAPKTQVPDISGVWLTEKFHPKLFPNGGAPFTPWAEAKFKLADPTKNDPNLDCLPEGVPRLMFVPLPMEIFQVPTRVIMLWEALEPVRQIYMNRQHPKDPDPTFGGDSIGRWEGDTLVVDTIGFNDKTWLDQGGLPHSDALHVVERIRRVDHDTLVDDVTIEDPKAYTKPVTARQVYKLKPGWEIRELVCTENNKYKVQDK